MKVYANAGVLGFRVDRGNRHWGAANMKFRTHLLKGVELDSAVAFLNHPCRLISVPGGLYGLGIRISGEVW